MYDEEQLEMAKTTIAPVTTKSESDENELTTTNNPSNNPTMPGLPTVEPTIDFAMMTPPGQAQPTCEWTQWTEWDKCSETCGGGQRNRYRNPIGKIYQIEYNYIKKCAPEFFRHHTSCRDIKATVVAI